VAAARGAGGRAPASRRRRDVPGQAGRTTGYRLFEEAGEDARSRLTLGAHLRRAIARDELVLHFQPVVDLATGPVGVEALVRWQHPEAGLLGPARFVPTAEQSGLIDELGAWVVDAACRQLRSWERDGLHPELAFNVSPLELRRPDFVATLAATVAAHGVDPGRLVAEITESAAMHDPARTEPALRSLDALGVRLALDDFGADHSSLRRLRELPFSRLKIDRGFLAGVPADEAAAATVTAMLALARALGMVAVVEGVEDEAQRRFLVSEGCPLAQGFGLARPMPAEQATAYLLAARGRLGAPLAARRPALARAA
jgi:EAL domain-containing protein (putative c-di-GMP-specific phosphodiesterase class I)